ncbi:hypothetical protein Tco_1317335 [Tanacetum coccineum]
MLAASGGGLILYQAYANLYAMTGRKSHLLEKKQILSVGVFDEVMAAPIIFISSNSSEESVGSHVLRVILFGTIPTSILVISVVLAEVSIAPADPLVAPKVGAVYVISPTGVLDLVDYSSSSDSDSSEDSLLVAAELPLVSPFLCSGDSKADSKSEPAEQRPERHESLTPSSEFPLAPVVAPPGIRRWPAILVRPGEAIPFGRPYRTHPNGPHHHSSPIFTSDSSSSSSSSDSPSDISSDSLSDSSSVHSSGLYALEVANLCLTLYPLRHQKSSLDSSFERSLDSSSPSAGPSRKGCRSTTTLVPSSTLVSRSIAPALADLSPRKRFRDSYSSEVSGEEHMEMDLGVEVDTSDIREDEEEFEAEASEGGTMTIVVDPLATGDIYEPTGGDAPDLEGTLYDMSHYMSEVPLDRITEFETTQRQLGLDGRIMRVRALLCIERDRVDSLRRHMALSQEEFRQVRRDRDDTRRRLRRLESLLRDVLDFTGTEALWLISALTWWNSHKRTIGADAAFSMSWRELMKPMAEIQELYMLCTKMVLEKEDRVEKFIGCLSDNIQGNVIAAEPTRLQDLTVLIANINGFKS